MSNITEIKKTIYTLAQVSEILKIPNAGRNNLSACLKYLEILNPNGAPYQEFLTKGYFCAKWGNINGHDYCKPLITIEGLKWLKEEVHEKIKLVNNEYYENKE